MATVSAARASATLPVPGTGVLRVAHGTYEHAANLAATTLIEYCRIPAGAVVVGGYWCADDLDTNSSEEINVTIGWAANGVEVADPDGFGDLGVMTGDVSVHLGAAGLWFPLQGKLIHDGPAACTFSRETVMTATIGTDAATGGTGTSSMVVYFYVP
jgi:hypothetical protein